MPSHNQPWKLNIFLFNLFASSTTSLATKTLWRSFLPPKNTFCLLSITFLNTFLSFFCKEISKINKPQRSIYTNQQPINPWSKTQNQPLLKKGKNKQITKQLRERSFLSIAWTRLTFTASWHGLFPLRFKLFNLSF